MKKKRNLFSLIPLLVMAIINLTGCPSNEKFGPDADYFIGLQKLEEKNYKEARQKFNNCLKKGTYYCARESAKQLAVMGNLQEKNEASLFLYNNFPGDDTLLILARQYYESKEYRKLLELTDNIDFANADNALIKIRLDLLTQMNMKEQYEAEIYKWFTSRAITQEQYQFFRDVYASEDEDLQSEPHYFAIAYRILLYRRDYLTGYTQAQQLLTYFEQGILEPLPMLVSDLGKAFLYGSEQIIKDAVFLRKTADSTAIKGTPAEFYFWFYAARLYDAANLYYSQSITCYENAIASTDDGSKQDNALWYLLKTKLKLSLDQTLSDMKKYSRSWHDPEYFDDFFDSLIPYLIVNGKWSSFKPLLDDIDGYASKEIIAQLSYLYARLVEQDYITLENEEYAEKEKIVKAAYEKALDSGTSVYYKVLAAYRLNMNENQIHELFGTEDKEEEVTEDKSSVEQQVLPDQPTLPADNLLNGYAYFGYPEKIYPAWQELFKQGVSTETGINIAQFLEKCAVAEKNDDYLVQALRIASRTANRSSQVLTKNQLKNVYPQYFSNLVDTYSKKYDINTSVVYALIRSESFFDKNVVSSAGAVGLTQLMSPTAGEIAQKLKIKEYTLTDPEINIMFGTYYLSELIRRGNGSLLRAFFSYNAGFRKVTTWLNSSLLDFGKSSSMDMDLFLETIPVSETREYGRKLIGATVMYEYIYENSDFTHTVESLLK